MLEIRNLVVRYGRVSALRQISLAIEANEAVTIIGSNGAGKSTLLRTISGLHRAATGSILFEGGDITRERPSVIVQLGIV